jgi:hypothetical protein
MKPSYLYPKRTGPKPKPPSTALSPTVQTILLKLDRALESGDSLPCNIRSQVDFESFAGLSGSVISHLRTGLNTNPSLRTVEIIGAALGYKLTWVKK